MYVEVIQDGYTKNIDVSKSKWRDSDLPHGKSSNLYVSIWIKKILKQVSTDVVGLSDHSMTAVLKSP